MRMRGRQRPARSRGCTQYDQTTSMRYTTGDRAYGGMERDLRRPQAQRVWEDENCKLKKLLSQTMLDASTLKEMLGRSACGDEL